MFNPSRTVIDAFVVHTLGRYREVFPKCDQGHEEILEQAVVASLETLLNCDCPYHDMEHTILVTDVGESILQGRQISQGDVSPSQWLHTVLACLFHDIGYLRGLLKQDRENAYIADEADNRVSPPPGATDACLMPYHVTRSCIFVHERYALEPLVDVPTVTSYIEMTRFPVPEDKHYQQTDSFAALAQAIATAKQAVPKAVAAIAAAKKLAETKPDTKAADKKVADAEAESKKLTDAVAAAEKKVISSERSVKVAEGTLTKIKGQLAERTKEKAEIDKTATAVDAALAEAKKQAAVLTPMKSVAFSEDGKQIATGDDSQMVRIWDATSGQELDTVGGHTAPVSAVGYTSKTTVVSGSADKTVLVQSIQPVWTLVAQLGADEKDPSKVGGSPISNRALCLDFSPDGKLLAVGGGDPSRSGEITIWDAATGKLVKKLGDAHSDTVLGIRFSRSGKSLLTGAADKFVKIFDVASGNFVKSFEGHTHHVLDVAWKADESTIVSSGADNVIKVWNIETGEQKRTISGYSKQVTSIAFLGLGDNIVSGGGDKTVRMHLTTNGSNYRNLSGSTDYVYSVAGSRDESIVIAGGEDGILRVWDAKTGKLLNSFNPPPVPQNQQASAGK